VLFELLARWQRLAFVDLKHFDKIQTHLILAYRKLEI
jgi:hypothetical protein